ncbi:MAG: DUF6686 family protein [Bacteroidota bacterium]
MCHNTTVINHTKNGFFLQCQECKIYQVSFGNIFLELTEKELSHFRTFLAQLDPNHWERVYCNCTIKRKIPIPTLQSNLQIMLNRAELEELKELLQVNPSKVTELIAAENVDYTVLLN